MIMSFLLGNIQKQLMGHIRISWKPIYLKDKPELPTVKWTKTILIWKLKGSMNLKLNVIWVIHSFLDNNTY